MSFFWFRASCTSRTVEGPLLHSTWRISSSEAVGFCGLRVMMEPYYEDIRSVNEELRRWTSSKDWPPYGLVSFRLGSSPPCHSVIQQQGGRHETYGFDHWRIGGTHPSGRLRG